MSTLFLVATPIGNLEDITARALRVLNEVEIIAAEDTRHTQKLLKHFNISTKMVSYHDHNKAVKVGNILRKLETGDIALVSDAGTPGINDPGYRLVRAALESGHIVTPIPGPSAPIAALAASGLPTDTFLYLGYLPRKSRSRIKLLKEIARISYTLIFFETPHRLVASLADLETILGDRQVAVARELTKRFESFFRGTLSGALNHYQDTPPRGEITLIVAGYSTKIERWNEDYLREVLSHRLEQGLSPSHLAREISLESGWGRRVIYQMLTKISNKEEIT